MQRAALALKRNRTRAKMSGRNGNKHRVSVEQSNKSEGYERTIARRRSTAAESLLQQPWNLTVRSRSTRVTPT